MNKDSNILQVHNEVSAEFMIDLRQFQLSRAGDIGFVISKNNTEDKNEDTIIVKFIHSTILMARSSWFRKAYKQYLKKNDESNIKLNEITQTAYKDQNRKICFDIQTVELKIFREFGKKFIKII